MNKIYLLVTVDVADGKFDEYVAALAGHVDTIRNEAGCEYIEYFVEDGVKDKVLLWEVWSTRQEWDAHMANTNSQNWREISGALVTKEEIKILHRI